MSRKLKIGAILAGLICIAILVALPIARRHADFAEAQVPPPPPGPLKIGMNLATMATEAPLLNRAKLGAAWNVHGVVTDPALLNADGLPIAPAPNGAHWESNIPLDAPTGSPFAQKYVVRWKGSGSVSLGIVGQETPGNHRITFVNIYGGVYVNIDNTKPSDPIRDISVVRLDQVAAYDAGKTINPNFIDKVIKPFDSFRTMDWDQTNNSTETNWSDRQKATDATYTRMPLELEVALANEAGVDLWKTIPAHATDDYVRQALSYIKANLSPNLKLHLEYSNEVWNGAFQQSTWAAAQAQSLWQLNNLGANTYYGYRAAQIAAIGWSVFGADSPQLRPVLAGWFNWTGPEVTDAMAKGVSLAGKGAVPALFREYAIAPYFGDAFGASPGNEADRAIVIKWAQDPSPAGLDHAFQQLEHGGLLQAKGTSLDDAKTVYEPHHYTWARRNGLALVAYEGGLSFYYYMADPPTKPILTAFFTRMLADPRMGKLYTRWMKDFSANGGTLIENFNDIGTVSEWGPWGALPNVYSEDTPRYAALRAMSSK